MPRTRPPYPPEFRRKAVELIRSGTALKQVVVVLRVFEQTLRNWRGRATAGSPKPGADTTPRESCANR